ncbi:bifunctional 4-hydroxy-2-oxoglutarate aldolase/2-dehydro-3-deoxy-phosphogluconate aldolase [Streptomyces sp. NPDC057580]|uniref:bifunctional 4-hydroxy-2-oxoglutarate aldolase/2-dehydro-3-deoxy-phosphogluconate aldolase n=1 Tax=Streptomyces sp. NPDC057580 TaxID=3346173 RepID=UPI0036797990
MTTVAAAQAAVAAGVDFIVTPTAEPAIVNVAQAARIPVLPGAWTPTEALRVWSAGASAVKLFPAATVGPSYLRHLRGPFPSLPIVPSGGYGVAEIPEWIRAGAVVVSLGSSLIGDAFDGDLDGLACRARHAVDQVAEARGVRPEARS